MTTRTLSEFGDELDIIAADLAMLQTQWNDGTLGAAGAAALALAIRARALLLLGEARTLDVAAASDDAVTLLGLIRWREGVCGQLIRMVGQLQEAAEAAAVVRGSLLTQARGYIVRTGDTFQSIAARHYGDWQRWPLIATANQMNPAAELPVGLYLTIPALDGQDR